MKVAVKKNKILFDNKFFTIEDLYNDDFYLFSNENVHKYFNDSFFVNELFLNFVQNFLVLERFVLSNNITFIDLNDSSEDLFCYFKDIASKNKIEVSESFYLFKYLSTIKFYYYLITSVFYLIFLMLKIPNRVKKKIENNSISIIRRKSSVDKVKKMNFNFEIEDPFSKNSIYSFFKISTRIKWVLFSFFDSCSQYKQLLKIMRNYSGDNSKYLISKFYSKRLVHSSLYKKLLDNFFQKNNFSVFYSFNNLDRFSMMEAQISKKYQIKLICLPHGLEYGFIFPKPFTGDEFFATSKLASTHLNSLYKTDKFVFNKKIIKQLFKNENYGTKHRKIVFFTEPREVEVNHYIIKTLLPLLDSLNFSLSVKLHPYDNLKDYIDYDIEIIKDFKSAIYGNICFARKSTILLEAIYNNSKASAIIINNKDKTIFNNFPSLQIDAIEQMNSINELFNWIKFTKKNDI